MKKYQFSKFLVAGGIAAGVNFGSRYLLSPYMAYVPSIILAYFIGMITAYLICRIFVFEPKRNSVFQQITFFTAVNILAIIQTVFISVIFADFVLQGMHDISMRETLSHLIGICVPVFTSFIGHKYVTFK